MIKNSSNSEKTIKTTIAEIPSDIWTIDKLQYYMNYNNIAILPESFLINDFDDYFENYLDEIDLDQKYFYSPSYFAEDYYGTPDVDFLVLYFAKIPTLFEFNKSKIKVLQSGKMKEINQIITKYKISVAESKDNPTKFAAINEVTSSTKAYLGYDEETKIKGL